MELNQLPIIDWEMATHSAGGNKAVAEELLLFLIKSLPDDVALLQKCYDKKNYDNLLKQTHRLHGALCYCGLPRLKKLVSQLELDLKNNFTKNICEILQQLHQEIFLLIHENNNLVSIVKKK